MFVSVIVPAFNASAWITEALGSILSQTWRDLEVIVVNDGSTDDTAEVVKSFQDSRVRMVCQDNRGAAAARNRGLADAKGDFIQFLDADDLLGHDKIGWQIDALRDAPAGSVASCAWAHFSRDPREAIVRPQPVWQVANPIEWLTCSLSGGGMMHSGGWLTPRLVVEAAGPWNEALSLHDDGEYFARVLLKATSNVFVPGISVYYRKVAGSLSCRRNRQAMESAFAVCCSWHRHLQEKADTLAIRRALATQYAQFAYEFCAVAPDLCRQAHRAIQQLREAPAPIIGGKRFRWAARTLGILPALRLRTLLVGFR